MNVLINKHTDFYFLVCRIKGLVYYPDLKLDNTIDNILRV